MDPLQELRSAGMRGSREVWSARSGRDVKDNASGFAVLTATRARQGEKVAEAGVTGMVTIGRRLRPHAEAYTVRYGTNSIQSHNFDSGWLLLLGSTYNFCKPSLVRSLI